MTIDTAIYNFVMNIKCDFMTNFFKFITFFASVYFMIGITLVILFLNINKKYKLLIALNMINDVVLNNIIKIVVKRQRPVDWFLVIETGYSFPSGHTMAAVCFYGLLIYLIYRSKIKNIYKKLGIIFFIILIFLIAISRIYLGVHYASDVIGAIIIALMYLTVYITVIESKLLNKKNT